MKKGGFLVFIFVFTFNQAALKSQILTIAETIDSINLLLKTNPYVDNFLEITFFYSVDIVSNNEFVVTMESPGSFKSVFTAKIEDLEDSYQKDTCDSISNTITWYCKAEDITGKKGCVYVEGTIPGGGESDYHQDNIVVMFSNRNRICRKLNNAFNYLFTKVRESALK